MTPSDKSTTSAMVSGDRWRNAIRMQPVDRLPFWPKLGGNYLKLREHPFNAMTFQELEEWLGSDRHVGVPGILKETRTSTAVDDIKEDGFGRTVYRSGGAELHMVVQYDEPSCSAHPVEFPVRTRDDIKVMKDMFDDVSVELDRDKLAVANEESDAINVDAITNDCIGESPLMYWIEWLAGPANGQYLLADYPDEVESLFDSIHNALLAKARILAEHSPADILYMVENTSTTLISPEQYRRYCSGHISDYAEICANADSNLVLHMCGHLKAVLPDLAELQVRAFEAYTSPPLGNTTLLDGRTACPDTCLIGGTNAVLWTRPADEIIAQLEKDLGELPHHRGIVVTSAGVMPPSCEPDTIKTVCDWVKAYPAIM